MNGQQVCQRLRAYQAGKPLPQYDTLHFPVVSDANLLILAFLRMGGESAPWGIAVGHPGRRPTLLTVPEPRNRDLAADMAAEFAPVLLEHFYHPTSSDIDDKSELESLPLHQVWLPNASHLEMLHHLAYAYTFTKWGEKKRAQTLNRLGRLAGWLFRESQRPGQVITMVATEALKTSYVFPAQDIRQSHLGFLLAWLTTSGTREKRAAAAADVERLPISTSLDPAVERDRLDKELERYNEAVKAGEARRVKGAAESIRGELEAELVHRFALVENTIRALRMDKRRQNLGVVTLERSSKDELWYRYLRGEVDRQIRGDQAVYTPSPETDRNPAAAAAQYYLHAASEEVQIAALLQDDPALQDEAIAGGDAFRGKVTSVKDEGTGRSSKPVWTVQSSLSGTRLRSGSCLCVAGLPSREVRVRKLERTANGSIALEIEITALKTVPRAAGPVRVLPATDQRLIGMLVTLVSIASDGISKRKAEKIWAKGTPGSWLTSGVPGGRRAVLPTEVADDLRAAGTAQQ